MRNKAKRSKKQLRSDFINALACVSYWQQEQNNNIKATLQCSLANCAGAQLKRALIAQPGGP